MAKKDPLTPDQKIKFLEAQLADKERELIAFRMELNNINQELEKFISQITSELKLAAHIQKTLVPTEIPTIPGFEFSTKFIGSSLRGGDYFDIFELQDKMRFGILLAHSSGHGVASLFLSVLMKLTTQIEAKKGMEPNDVLKYMTKEIQAHLKGTEKTDVFYAVVDRRRYQLNYSRAGLVQGYVFKNIEDKLVRLDATQAAIGKESKAQYKTESIGLDARDKLILTTHGIFEVPNKHGEKFGEERLVDIILDNSRSTCHDLRNEILFQLSRFSGTKEYPDDVSVLVMEVKDKVIKLKKG